VLCIAEYAAVLDPKITRAIIKMTRDFENAERTIMPKRTPSINLKKSVLLAGG
tara:strand:+ start:429 stop:587 length:159 start_codon:yes stop_codon:yes gene_type:complete